MTTSTDSTRIQKKILPVTLFGEDLVNLDLMKNHLNRSEAEAVRDGLRIGVAHYNLKK